MNLFNGAERAKTLNLIGPAIGMVSKPVIRDPKIRLAIARDCKARFWSQVAMSIMIAEAAFYKLHDICEERKMLKFNPGKWMRKTKECFDKFDEWMNSGDKQTRNLVNDYSIQVDKRVWREKRDLYLTFKVYYDKLGLQDTDFKAEVTTVMELIHLAVDLFDGFFDVYRDCYGVDLREDYKKAYIKEADLQFERFAVDVIRNKKIKVEPAKHYASLCAYNALVEKLLNEKMIDAAGTKALELNHEDEFLSMIEKERMGLDRLKDKFNVSTK